MGPGREAVDAAALLDGFSACLSGLGLPLARATTHAPTLHPSFRWVMRVWHPGASSLALRRRHGIETTPTFHGNTVEHVVETRTPFRCRLDGDGPLPFPVLGELSKEGLTDYLIAPLRAARGRMGAASWATVRPGGFTPIEIDTLLALVEPFSLLFEIKALDDMLGAILSAYVGRDPARQILAGTVRRGDVRLMRAAMMLTDLRGFGELSDRQSPDRVVAALNRMFDAIVPAVEAESGEVLKYIGDGLLAVFDADRDEAEARRAALRAAEAALDALATLRDGHRPAFEVGVALHVGEVAYGNIGGGDRVDFTAIGRDLNVLARVERLCKTYDTPLIATDTFLDGLAHSLEPLGTVAPRGFAERHALFGHRRTTAVEAPAARR